MFTELKFSAGSPSDHSRPLTNRAFTLIELLVVIAIKYALSKDPAKYYNASFAPTFAPSPHDLYFLASAYASQSNL